MLILNVPIIASFKCIRSTIHTDLQVLKPMLLSCPYYKSKGEGLVQ